MSTRPKGVSKSEIRRLVREGRTDREVAAIVGIHPMTARWHRIRLRLAANRRLRRWTAAEVGTVRRVLDGGGSVWNAALAVGRTPAAVRQAIQRHKTEVVQCSS